MRNAYRRTHREEIQGETERETGRRHRRHRGLARMELVGILMPQRERICIGEEEERNTVCADVHPTTMRNQPGASICICIYRGTEAGLQSGE